MMPLTGRLIDWLGTKLSYTAAVVVWSIAAMAHALARSASGFSAARFALGFGEAANFPAAIKSVTEWFAPEERALATGIFNSGSNVGAIAAPLMVPWIAANWGWRLAFIITGSLGFIWVVLWLWIYREPAARPQGEAAVRIPYLQLLKTRQAWAVLIGKFLTDPVWWFYLFWLPGFLYDRYGLNLTQLGPPLVAVYVAADVGSIGGGWISSKLLASGMSVNRARKLAMLVCAIAVVAAAFVMFAGSNMWLAVTLVSIAAASHQGWSANLYTLISDLFPREWVGSVVGLTGMGGAIGGMLVAPALGRYLKWSGSAYGPVFVVAGTIYLVALFVIDRLVPNLDRDRVGP